LIEAVVFDLDGVLVQSEEVWDAARREVVAEAGLPWPDDATRAMMGMSSVEWSSYLHDRLGVPLSPEQINADVLRRVEQVYRRAVPWIAGAQEAVERIGERWPLGLATSSNREIIDVVLDAGGLRDRFAATVSSEEVGAGKPAPDVYLEALRRLGVAPEHAAAIEDSTNGLLAAQAAGMGVIAIPNDAQPPESRGLSVAAVVLDSLRELTPEFVESAAAPLPTRAACPPPRSAPE
jgi:HAD superfamily hydrolase (TIGR01509 family)